VANWPYPKRDGIEGSNPADRLEMKGDAVREEPDEDEVHVVFAPPSKVTLR
jgi:hypothetical protein